MIYQDGFTRGQSFDEVAKAAFGSAPAPVPAPDPTPTPTPTPTPNPAPEQSLASFTGVTDQGCAACGVDLGAGSVQARIGGGADGSDTANGIADFGGTAGSTGRVFARTVLGLGKGQTLAANLAVLQMRAVDGSILYELYVASDRKLRLWSTGGAMRASSINESAGVVVPNDGSSIRVEVSALANNSIVVRVDGIDKLTVSNLTGATGGKPRYLVAGIDHYDTTTTNEPVAVAQSAVGVSGTGWLGAPSTAPVVAPVNTTVPRLTGSAIVGQTLSADTGTWSGSPTGTTTQWQRCTTAGACSAIAGATGTTYAVAADDIGSTLRASVTAANAGGSTTALSAASAVVAAAIVPTVPNLAPTPDYESDPRSSYYALGTGTFTWATDAAHSGTHSLKIVSSQSAGSLARWLALKAIPATARRTYSVSAWLKTANTTGSAVVVLNFWSSAGIYLGTWWSSDLTGSQAWTKLNVAATAPAGTASVRVEYRLTGPGTLWADDLTLNG